MSDKRNYQDQCQDSEVRKHYRQMRLHQNLSYYDRMNHKFLSSPDRPMNFWQVFDHLENLIDLSDPDLENTANMFHAFQTAEKIRHDPNQPPRWFQLVGLIHDLGKIMYLKGNDFDGNGHHQQWGMVGDTFVLGCRLSDKLIYPEYNQLNLSKNNKKLGIYKQHCGFDQCYLTWGHDEYLYGILSHPCNKSKHTLPYEALYIIRYHSFYPWHQKGAYAYLANEYDRQMRPWLQKFSEYDLYSKDQNTNNIKDNWKELKDYYQKLISEFFSNDVLLW